MRTVTSRSPAPPPRRPGLLPEVAPAWCDRAEGLRGECGAGVGAGGRREGGCPGASHRNILAWGMRAGAPLFKRPAWGMTAEAWVLGETPVQPHCRQEEKGGRKRGGGSSPWVTSDPSPAPWSQVPATTSPRLELAPMGF